MSFSFWLNLTFSFFDSEFADLPNSCYYTTQVALESQIEKAIKLVKDEFGIIIEADYLNDGCSSSESLNTAIQRYFFCLIIQILRDHKSDNCLRLILSPLMYRSVYFDFIQKQNVKRR